MGQRIQDENIIIFVILLHCSGMTEHGKPIRFYLERRIISFLLTFVLFPLTLPYYPSVWF